MSNDITALAQRMKAAAEKATPGEWWIDSHGMAMVAHHNENTMIIFVTDGEQMGEAIRHEDTGNLSHWRNDNDATFIATANPANVLALVEALEARDKQIAEHNFENRLLANADRDIKALRQRIAELESREPDLYLCRVKGDEDLYSPCGKDYPRGRGYYVRPPTVTIELPLPSCTYADHSYPAYSKRQVVSILAAAGINVEAE